MTTDPKVIEALDNLANAITQHINGEFGTAEVSVESARRSVARLIAASAPADPFAEIRETAAILSGDAPETPAPKPDDLPSVWLTTYSIDKARSNVWVPAWTGASDAGDVEYVPRAQLAARIASLPATATRDDVLALLGDKS